MWLSPLATADCKVNYRAIGRGNGGVVKKRTPTFVKDVDPPTPSSVPTKYQTILPHPFCFSSFFHLPAQCLSIFVNNTFVGWPYPAILPVFPCLSCFLMFLTRYRNNREQKGFLGNAPRFPTPRAQLTPGPGLYETDEPLDGPPPEPMRGRGGSK